MSTPTPKVGPSRAMHFAVAAAILVAVVIVVATVLTASSPSENSTGFGVATHTGVVTNSTTVLTSGFNVPAESLVLVFVSYINVEAGGGAPESVTDTAGDNYIPFATTGFSLDHTESLYVAASTSANSGVVVMVPFGGGAAPQGGSVAVVVVSHAGFTAIATFGEEVGISGTSPTASVALTTNRSGELCILGVAGRGVSGPFSAGAGETLLDTGTGTGGPFEDGVGYGTFAMTAPAGSVALTATLNTPTWWEAIGIALLPP